MIPSRGAGGTRTPRAVELAAQLGPSATVRGRLRATHCTAPRRAGSHPAPAPPGRGLCPWCASARGTVGGAGCAIPVLQLGIPGGRLAKKDLRPALRAGFFLCGTLGPPTRRLAPRGGLDVLMARERGSAGAGSGGRPSGPAACGGSTNRVTTVQRACASSTYNAWRDWIRGGRSVDGRVGGAGGTQGWMSVPDGAMRKNWRTAPGQVATKGPRESASGVHAVSDGDVRWPIHVGWRGGQTVGRWISAEKGVTWAEEQRW